MFASRTLALLAAAALSATVAATGSSTIVNNCGYSISAQTTSNVGTPQLQQSGVFTIAPGGTVDSGAHSSGWFALMWNGDEAQHLGFETGFGSDSNTVKYDLFIEGSSPVGNDFALSVTDSSCRGIVGGQGNFDPDRPDTFTCGTGASLTLTLCS